MHHIRIHVLSAAVFRAVRCTRTCEQRLPGGGRIQAKDAAHGRRLARTIWPQKTRDHSVGNGEAQVIDGKFLAVSLA